jgi:hypothetical protein
MKRLIFPTALAAIALLPWSLSFPQGPGQPPPAQEDPADAAEHGVARLSVANGSVTVIRADSGEPFGATVNQPLETGDEVATGQGSRAEVQFDSANMIRLTGDTRIRMSDLQYHRSLVQIDQGTTLLRVLRDNDAQIEIGTPSVSIVPLRQGIYRITVRPDGSSEITVRAGEAELISRSGTEPLPAGQTVLSRGSYNDAEIMGVGTLPYDDWDRWNADRDRFFERAPDVSRYAGPDIEGAQELANYGRWVWDTSYGYVWVPGNIGPDWAPYRDGRWDYLDYYGWTWTSYDPWGWAPYHYGNWYRGPYGWAWYPGPVRTRHYWRPAMVAFFGFGSPGFGASLSFGYGNVGWVPLAPYERYRPWYGRGYTGGRYGAVIANSNIENVYRNARVNGAVTGLRAGDFGRVRVGRNSFVRPDSGDLARAGIVNGGVPFAPARNFSSGNSGRLGNSQGRFANDGGRFNRGPAAGASNGVWHRLEAQPGAPAVGGNRSDVRILPSQREPQPVRISPPIVTDRPQGYTGSRDVRNSFGGFGGPRPETSPGNQQAVPVREAAPPARGDGSFYRVAPGGSRDGSGINGAEPPRGYGGRGEYRSAPPSREAPRSYPGGGGGNNGGNGSRSAPPSAGGPPGGSRGNNGGGNSQPHGGDRRQGRDR